MNDEVFAQLKREGRVAERADDLKKAEALLKPLLPPQRAIDDDPARRKGVLCPGRAGKTTAFGRIVAATAKRKRRPNIAYVSLTQKNARGYLWQPLLEVNQLYELGFEPKNTEGRFDLPGGGKIEFFGAATADEAEKLRGFPWDLVIIDEAKSIAALILKALLGDILPPRLADRRGTLIVGGTPGAALFGSFFDITGAPGRRIRNGKALSRPWRERELEKWQGIAWEWSCHHWPLSENTAPGVEHLWRDALALKALRGWSDDHPLWLREYMGEWATDETGRLYRFDPERNLWTPGKKDEENPFGLPRGYDWYFALGVDIGFSDPFCIQTLAFADTHPALHQVAEFYKRGLTYRQQAEAILAAQAKCGERLIGTAVDPARKSSLATLTAEHGVPLQPAEKREKRDALELASADFYEGRVLVLRGSQLHEQAATLTYDETGLKEPENVENDASDGFLYAHRLAQHRFAREAPAPQPAKGSPEWQRAREDAEEERAAERERRQYQDIEDDFQTSIDDVGEGWFRGGGDRW